MKATTEPPANRCRTMVLNVYLWIDDDTTEKAIEKIEEDSFVDRATLKKFDRIIRRAYPHGDAAYVVCLPGSGSDESYRQFPDTYRRVRLRVSEGDNAYNWLLTSWHFDMVEKYGDDLLFNLTD